jgi:stage IV sporulation protein FB
MNQRCGTEGGYIMRVRVNPLAGVLAAGGALISLLSVWFDGDGLMDLWRGMAEALTVAAAALLHELGHIAAAWGWGIPIKALRLDLFGARMELWGLIPYRAELAVAAGGPLVSLLAVSFALSLGGHRAGAYLFAAVSLGLGGLNLLPVRGLDGGRMLFCLLAMLLGERAADVILRVTTGLALGGLWLLSVYALLRAGEALSLFAFALCLLLRLLGT